MNDNIGRLLYKIKNCVRFEYLYKLEEYFNSVGLSLQQTANDSMVLCRIQDGKPCCSEIIDDYIFVGSLEEKRDEISDKMARVIQDFVRNNCQEPGSVDYAPKTWQNGVLTYGKVVVVNEAIDRTVQTLTEDEWPPTTGTSTIIG